MVIFALTMSKDIKFMHRCLQLARLGTSYTSPNPLVGAVVVHNDQIIGEGYHRRYGDAHAEPMAINSVKNPQLLSESTLYVNLEPCSHYGKTPPCAELIVSKRIKRVVIASHDPNPKVAGKGIKMLQEAGIEVLVGVLEKEERILNKRFYTFQELKRPYITLKWAQTADGFIDKKRDSADEAALLISNPITSQLTHKMRAENMAIMVSTNTALLDNPSLTLRNWSGRNPIRLVLDRQGRVPNNLNVKDGNFETVILTEKKINSSKNLTYITTDFDFYDLKKIFQELYKLKINSILVEGGAKLHQSIIDAALWDEANVEISPKAAGSGVAAPVLKKAVEEHTTKFDNHIWRNYKRIKDA